MRHFPAKPPWGGWVGVEESNGATRSSPGGRNREVAGVAEKRKRELQKRETERARGKEREKKEMLPGYSNFSNLYQSTINSNFHISLITFAYELRFLRTTCPRTRIDEHYNFHEGSFPKFPMYKKSLFETP
jgi:hypothetical protein